MSTFQQRVKWHDKYKDKIKSIFRKYNLRVEDYGQENQFTNAFHKDLLRQTDNRTSSWLRFQPDIAVSSPTILFEIKSKPQGSKYDDLFLELKPWEVVKDAVNKMGLKIFYILPNFRVANPNQIVPNQIFVFESYVGYTDRMFEQIKSKYKNTNCRKLQNSRGSGTPCLVYDKYRMNQLDSLEYFIENEIK